jgi:hypothetical protein
MAPKDVADLAGGFMIVIGVLLIVAQVIIPNHFANLAKTLNLPGGTILQTNIPGFGIALLGFLLIVIANGLNIFGR